MRYLLSENKRKNIVKEEGISTCPFYNSDTHSYKKQEKALEVIALKVINKWKKWSNGEKYQNGEAPRY